MAVIIGTASAVADLFGAGVDGFTDGDPQAGVPATEFSDDWCNGVQQEINNAIDWSEDATLALDNTDREQLAKSIDYQNRHVYPRINVTSTYYWRSHATAGAGAEYQRMEESGYRVEAADSSVQNVVGLLLPNNSQANVILRGSLVKSDDMTVYGNGIYAASIVNDAGTYTLQSFSPMLEDIALIGLILEPIASGGIYLRFTIPASVGNVFNIFATVSAEIVKWS